MSNRTRRRQKLPAGIYYTPRNGGMYVSWDGRPEGQIAYTFDRETAYGEGNDWGITCFQGADGGCYLHRIIKLAVEYTT